MLVPISFEIHPVADESFSPETNVSGGVPLDLHTMVESMEPKLFHKRQGGAAHCPELFSCLNRESLSLHRGLEELGMVQVLGAGQLIPVC
jgi:hypothetical protein